MKTKNTAGLRGLHWPILLLTCLITALGIYNLHSSAAAHQPMLYMSQIYWFLIGLGVIAGLLVVDYRVTESIAYPFFVFTCALLVAVLVGGRVVQGAQRWLQLGPLRFQPSEIAKIATVLCLARYFGQRIEPGGYSLGALFKPFNLSRPLACMAVLVLFWKKPWLVDPVGELARFVRRKFEGITPTLDDSMWFRLLLILFLVGGATTVIVWIVKAERASQLLNPWPVGRRRRLIRLSLALFVSLALVLVVVWNEAVVRDPFGVALIKLNAAAAAGGRYAVLNPGLTLRLLVLGAVLLYLAAALNALRGGFNRPSDAIIAPIDLLALPALLVLVEPDLGTAGVILLTGMSMILVVGVRLRSLAMLALMATLVSGVAWFGLLKDYQKRRVLTFIDPEHDVKGAGWNAVQSMIAVGSGRWFGSGHMGGTQTQLSFLPEQHTDFAFSVWAEEQGFVGCSLLLAAYVLLLLLALSVAAEAREAYGTLLATGVVAMIFWHAVINVGMVIGALPVVGITLPLFSYGGTSLVSKLLGVGLLLNVHWRRRGY